MISKAMEPAADALRVMILDAMAVAGMAVDTDNEDARGRWVVDGVSVPIRIDEAWSGSTWHTRPAGKLRVKVDECRVYPGDDNWGKQALPTKSFLAAKSRAATHGIDIPALVEHVRKWVNAWRAETKRQELRGSVIDQWQAVLDSIGKEALGRIRVEATDHGLVVKRLEVDEAQLRGLIALMGGGR